MRLKALALGITLSLAALRGQALPLPEGLPAKPANPVTDLAGMLSGPEQERLNQALRRVWKQGQGPQVSVLVVNSLGGRPIEDYSLAVARGWGLGGEATDNGVLLLIARGDRKIRIEVGTKLEGLLTDVASKRIIEDVMAPRLRQGDADGAVEAGVAHILAHLGREGGVEAPASRPRPRGMSQWKLLLIVLGAFIVLRVVMPLAGVSPSRRRGWPGSSSGGGWGGGGFGGGGGFSGGGGGFSGGGSSGSW